MKGGLHSPRSMVWIATAALGAAVVFILGHAWLISVSALNPWESAAMTLLILCELFMFMHSFGYFLNVGCVSARDARAGRSDPPVPALASAPPVAFVMCSYREPLAVIEANMVCFRNLTYPAKRLYLLDDTPYDQPCADPEALLRYRADVESLCRRIGLNLFRHRWRGAKAGMINDFLDFLAGRERDGFEFTTYQRGVSGREAKYLAVFDADMNPLPDFAEPLVASLENDDRLAFVQTPQFYSNTSNRVAHGAALQQAVFYEYICDGKSMQEVMPCCGTNVMFRIAALEEVGGMDESSVTEDFATSIQLHLRGWRSIYLNRVCAFGMGPQDLGAFFRQQFRWASGTVGLLRVVTMLFLRNPRAFPARHWLEYLTSVSYYCMGWVWVIIWCFPMCYIFFGFPHSLARTEVFFALFIPYFVFTFWAFIGSLRHRGYNTLEVFAGLTMNVISFPIYMKASALGLLGIRGSFRVTPKEGATSLPLHRLWPQLLALSIAVLTSAWGLNHLFYGTLSPGAVLGNLVWCAYNGVMIGMILYFNRPDASAAPKIYPPANPSTSSATEL
jgi:cellulose synthase (UDP-forming)